MALCRQLHSRVRIARRYQRSSITKSVINTWNRAGFCVCQSTTTTRATSVAFNWKDFIRAASCDSSRHYVVTVRKRVLCVITRHMSRHSCSQTFCMLFIVFSSSSYVSRRIGFGLAAKVAEVHWRIETKLPSKKLTHFSTSSTTSAVGGATLLSIDVI